MEPLLNHASCCRRGDFLFHNPDLVRVKDFNHWPPNVDVIGDIKVSFPCSDSYLDKGSHNKPGLTADIAYKQKHSKYKKKGLDLHQGRSFIPISIESFGRFHPLVKPFIGLYVQKQLPFQVSHNQFFRSTGSTESRSSLKEISRR